MIVRPSLRNLTWINGSNEEIIYRDEIGEYAVMNVKDGSTYPGIDPRMSRTYFLLYLSRLKIPIPYQHISTLYNCRHDKHSSDNQCIFRVLLLSFLNMALSRAITIISDIRSFNGSFQWIPYASTRCNPLLKNDLYVIHIVGLRIISYDEVLVYFIAAPLHSGSERFLYQLKVTYPPLEYQNHELPQCMTCPENFKRSPTLITEHAFETNTRGHRTQCTFSNILMSRNCQYYILKCKLRLLLRIANHQNNQLVTDEYELSLATHLASLGNYAVLYTMTVVKHVTKYFHRLDLYAGNGVFGGHMVLNLIAGPKMKKFLNKEDHNLFQCCAAIRPFTHWQNYIHPFTMKPTEGIIGVLRRKNYKVQYLLPLARHLRGTSFTLLRKSPEQEKYQEYFNDLVEMLSREGVSFNYHIYGKNCSSRFKLYEDLRKFFKKCFNSPSNCHL
ncbi:PREDICTED: uncharacterized protein LOC105366659 [Ceratosolen solmsi marchali]|uniref:Uncharacterized protein LOC105366659 n=1 Tax=Ceratosolen solmsi marchali TaxID=326594 RepID=A0AAJ6YSI8_9HYME|nr:PREDICTED: uncharacterized protein LOC105366659 [Ceratosolen solmsi marchali]